MKKGKNNHGFTLGELLIVVGIIAVLVSISIPIFNKQLEKSRDAASVANIRSVYAGAQIAYMDAISSGQMQPVIRTPSQYKNNEFSIKYGDVYYRITPSADGSRIDHIHTLHKDVHIKSKEANNWSGMGDNLPFKWQSAKEGDTGKPGDYCLDIHYNEDGSIKGVELY